MNEAAISRRIDELLELCSPKEETDWIAQGTAIVQGNHVRHDRGLWTR